MMDASFVAAISAIVHVLVQLALCVRVLLRPHREPASRIAWIVVVLAMPVVGIVAYVLLGEVNIGRRRVARMREVLARMPKPADAAEADAKYLQPDVPERYVHLFRVGHSINGLEPVGGNRAHLLPDSNAAIDAVVADIDAAQDHVHVLFYIWLPDTNGCKVVEALKRAAARNVTCRAMADGLGSRLMIRSEHWAAMRAAGVHLAEALPIGNPLLRPLKGRIDLRNHRKIVVIDDRITYCGSQNCADPEFRVKAKYAPWVDAVMRFEGPIARQNQHLFAGDWMGHVDDDIADLLRRPLPPAEPGLTAQVIGTGPTVRYSAMPEMFESLMYTARRELVISTQLGHARDVRIADVHCPPRAGHFDPVLRSRRVDAGRVVRQCPPRRRHHDHLPGAKRLVDRGGGESQLLRRIAGCGGADLRIRGRAAAHQVADAGR